MLLSVLVRMFDHLGGCRVGEASNPGPTSAGGGSGTWPGGQKYGGERKGGKRHGEGVGSLDDEGQYDGEWKDGKMHGKGVKTCLGQRAGRSMKATGGAARCTARA
jgi:hypothetical protein